MSAIAGFWSFDGRPVRDQIQRILKGQSAYGSRPADWSNDVFGLGRLLHPLLAEDQFDRGPVTNDRYALVADVRLDNRAELAGRLGIGADRLARLSDAALLFECLLQWGDATPDLLAGEFAFAWWDSAERRLMMCRDILGHRPLHFHQGKGFFAFATMPSGLHALTEVPRDFDPDFMAESLALLPRLDERTYFRNVQRVRPGHFVVIEESRSETTRYWRPGGPVSMGSDPHAIEQELRSLVDQAVAAHLRGAGALPCTHLSAGLDSAIVASSAAAQREAGSILAFTACPSVDFQATSSQMNFGDEGPGAASVAERYPNLQHMLISSSAGSPLEALDREHFYQQQPVANLENAVWGRAMLREANARGAIVMLTGAVGNVTATYAGMEHLGWLVGRGSVLASFQLWRALSLKGVPARTLAAYAFGPLLPRSLWKAASRLRGWVTDLQQYSAVSPSSLKHIQERCRDQDFDMTYRPSRNPVEARLDVLADCDGGSYFKGVLAEWGVSVREPLADKRVIEFCLSVPPEEFIRDGMPRSLARRAFADRLPQAVASNLARGYQSADWHVALEHDIVTLRAEVNAVARCEPAAAAMDLGWIKQAVASFPAGNWTRRDIVMRYRYGLLRAVSAGHFMRKVAGTN